MNSSRNRTVHYREELLAAAAPQARAPHRPFTINTREELINGLMEAAELEHGLMLQYLYAALSAKRSPSEGVTERELETIRRWQRLILTVARDEMAHLATVMNLLSAVGGAPHFARPNFPQHLDAWFPFQFELGRLSRETIARFRRFEQPVPTTALTAAIAPDPVTYDFVGELYGRIAEGIGTLGRQGLLFIGPPEVQDASDWSGSLKIIPVTSEATALAAIKFIVTQGEGSPGSIVGSHYHTFSSILAEYDQMVAHSPHFDPARPVATTPLTRPHRDSPQKNPVVRDPLTKECSELASHLYCTMLLMLMQFFDYGGETREQRDVLQASARRTMSAIVRPLAELLTLLPIADDSQETAGLPFEIFAPLALSSHVRSRFIVLEERVAAANDEIQRLMSLGDPRLARLEFVHGNVEWLLRTLQMLRS